MPDFTHNEPHNRLIGDMPKIGIRPTIDGRLGACVNRWRSRPERWRGQ